MLKCGQKDNKNYIFGVRKEQIEDVEKVTKQCCIYCGKCFSGPAQYCPFCGKKL